MKLTLTSNANIVAYCESCSNIADAFMTSRFTTGPILIAEY